MLYKVALALCLLLTPSIVVGQRPTSVRITTTSTTDTVKITISWPKLVTVTGTYNTYDVLTFSNPRLFETEQLRVVTGTSWTLAVPKSKMVDGLKFYASVRASSTPTYGAITYTSSVVIPPVDTATPPPPIVGPIVSLNSGIQYQTIDGWETSLRMWEQDKTADRFAESIETYSSAVANYLVDSVGINSVRLQLASGIESPNNTWADFVAHRISYTEWSAGRYEKFNDNNDPMVANLAGFQFDMLDYQIEKMVLPMKARLAARGETLRINLNLVDFNWNAARQGTLSLATNPAEMAELVLVVFQHMQTKYGFVPDSYELILEPENTALWRGPTIGSALVAIAARLSAAGFHPEFIAPSTTSMSNAVPYFNAMLTVPGVSPLIGVLAYHRYGGESAANASSIWTAAKARGIKTAMLEKVGAGIEQLLEDLTVANVSAWQQWGMADESGHADAGAYYARVVLGQPPATAISMASRTPQLAQIFRNVRRGAVRIGATSTEASHKLVAFVNPDSTVAVIVKATASGPITFTGLPSGTYTVTFVPNNGPTTQTTMSVTTVLATTTPSAGILSIRKISTTPPVVTPPPTDTTVTPPPTDTTVTPPPADTTVTPPPVIPPSAGTLPSHPRVWMDASRIAHLKRERSATSLRWTRVLALADAQVLRGAQYSSADLDKVPSLCLVYLATDDVRYATRVGAILTNYATEANTLTGDSGYGVRFALPLVTMGLDWCYNGLTVAQRQQAATWLMNRADWVWPESNAARLNAHGTNLPGNYFWGFLMTGPAALAAAGDDTGTGTLSGSDRATFHQNLVLARWNGSIATFFTGEGTGGAWTEGTKYESAWRLGSLVDGFRTSGIAMTTPFLEASLRWRLHSTMPGFVYKVPFGDQPGMPKSDLYTYDRLQALYALSATSPDSTLMSQVYYWLNQIGKVPTTEFNATAMLADELLRFDPNVTPATDLLSLPKHYLAPGVGFFIARASWNDPNATVIAFESGPTGDHGARDANGLMIWKGSFWISATANIYSHTGIEGATVNYNNLTVGGVGQYLYGGNGGTITGTFASDTLVRVGGQAKNGYGYQNQWANTRFVDDYRREVAFFPVEDVIVVVDRATAKVPSAAKVWRWHSKNAAVITGNTFVLTNPAGDQRCHATIVHPTATLGSQTYALDNSGTVTSNAVTVTMSGQASDVVVTIFQCNGQAPLVPQVTVGNNVTVTIAGRVIVL